MAMTREEIVSTAITLLDEVGLEGLTLRRLATELGVSAPTIYWHVDDKRHLLDLMVEGIFRDAEISPRPRHGQPWWEWLAESARGQRSALLAHRDAALVVAGNRPTEGSFDRIEETLATLVSVGFPPVEALGIVLAVGDYVLGSAVESQSSAARPAPTEREQEMYRTAWLSGERPTWSAAVRALRESIHRETDWLEEVFEAGLSWLIAGIRARHLDLAGYHDARIPADLAEQATGPLPA